jgi:hypothetical protein
MALFLTLLTNSIELALNSYHIEVSSWITTLLTTLCLILFSNLLTNMSTICLFSVIGTLSTLMVCVMVLVMCMKEIKFDNTWGSIYEYWIHRRFYHRPITSISFSYFMPHVKLFILHQIQCFGIYRQVITYYIYMHIILLF